MLRMPVARKAEEASAPNDAVRLVDILASLSLVSDLGLGLPPDDAMRSCLVGAALARQMGLEESLVTDVFYTSLLQHIGCTGYAHESHLVWHDDVGANRAAQRTNFARPTELFTAYLPSLTRGMSVPDRLLMTAYLVTKGPGFLKRFTLATCEIAAQTARRIGLSEGVQQALYQVFEWWNGKGAPRGRKGDEIALAGRIAHVAGLGAKFDVLGGTELAIQAVRSRSGSIFDPDIANVFVSYAPTLLKEANLGDPRQRLIEVEPKPAALVPLERLTDLASVFGDIADLKTPFTHGHSTAVARMARMAGEKLRLDSRTLFRLDVASRLHDIGQVGVADSVWEKPHALSTSDWEQIRLHPYHTERILSCSPLLKPMAAIAALHHERLDGSGYHRGSMAVPMPARILAAADALHAMTQSRPHRNAMTMEQAAEALKRDARAGRLDSDAVGAVLDAVGAAPPKRAGLRPGGLSDREIEVLGLMAQGLSNRAIGKRLHISARTAEHHIQHIYAKIGVSSRPAAALYAMEHGLLW
jgi:HD-GYP domain-containing protein (c-di-GMP phosphodiesterase class II)